MSAADRERHVDQARARSVAKHAETTDTERETWAKLDALAAAEIDASKEATE